MIQIGLYSAIIILYFAAGGVDMVNGEYKAGVIAIMFGIINAIIFLWR